MPRETRHGNWRFFSVGALKSPRKRIATVDIGGLVFRCFVTLPSACFCWTLNPPFPQRGNSYVVQFVLFGIKTLICRGSCRAGLEAQCPFKRPSGELLSGLALVVETQIEHNLNTFKPELHERLSTVCRCSHWTFRCQGRFCATCIQCRKAPGYRGLRR